MDVRGGGVGDVCTYFMELQFFWEGMSWPGGKLPPPKKKIFFFEKWRKRI